MGKPFAYWGSLEMWWAAIVMFILDAEANKNRLNTTNGTNRKPTTANYNNNNNNVENQQKK